jgi:CRISPR-associated protein Csd1
MVLDSATTGRLSITYYRELKAGDYLERVAKWHTTCIWLHHYKKGQPFVGAPSFRDIVSAAYGVIADKEKERKLIKSTIERLLPCVLDDAKLPIDLVNAAVNRASNPVACESWWEWEKTLSVACALYNKWHTEGRYDVALNEQRNDRDYLYGRLLAVADWVEESVLREQGEGKRSRPTNAMRLMSAFAQNPFRIWATITRQLSPYEVKLDLKYPVYKKLMTGITSQFKEGDFEKTGRLDGSYLLGYHCQRQKFFDQMEEAKRIKQEKEGGKRNESDK